MTTTLIFDEDDASEEHDNDVTTTTTTRTKRDKRPMRAQYEKPEVAKRRRLVQGRRPVVEGKSSSSHDSVRLFFLE